MRFFFLGAFALAATFCAQAQTSTASLSGTIFDQQESVITAATVTLEDPARGLKRQAISSSAGTFLFPQLAPSTYEIAVEHAGFQRARLTGIVLNADDQRSVRVRLAVATRDETVLVTGDAPLVREAPSVATSVDR